jgi:hypothetical protein
MRSPLVIVHAPSAGRSAETFQVEAGEVLEWDQPSRLRSAWELHRRGDRIARLARARWWGRRHLIETPRGSWWLGEGWLGRVELHRDGEPEVAARYQAGWLMNGRVWLADGSTLRWRRTSWGAFWNGTWELRTEEEFPVLRFRLRREFLRCGGTIEVVDGAETRPGLEAAILLGWYLSLASTRHHAH